MERYIAKHKRYEFFEGGKHHGSKYDSNSLHAWLNNGFMDALLHFVKLSGHNKIFKWVAEKASLWRCYATEDLKLRVWIMMRNL